MTARLLCVGDLHLGRRAGGLPDDAVLAAWGLDARGLGPVGALRAVVDWAVAERPDAVVLAGDVVDGDNDRFEAWRPLRESAQRLTDAGIPLIGVAGNHDVEALPRLARTIDAFTLLGEGGRWETHDVARDGQVVARLLGWSFPQRQVTVSPLEQLEDDDLPPMDDVPLLGVLHGDLDASSGTYAPVSSSALREVMRRRGDLRGWVLGHIHAPSLASDGELLGYLGSAAALDAGEAGVHGPWLLELEGESVTRSQLGLSPVRWEQLRLDVTGGTRPLSDADPTTDLQPWLLEQLEEWLAGRSAAEHEPRLWSLRLDLEGETEHHAALVEAGGDVAQALAGIHKLGGRLVHLQRVRVLTRPALPLEELARGGDPPGLLARRVLALQAGGEQADELVRAARKHLLAEVQPREFGLGADASPDGEALRELLLRAARDALAAVTASSEAGS